MNKLFDLVYISAILYLILPQFVKLLKNNNINETTIKIMFLVSVLLLECIFYSTNKAIFNRKIDFSKMFDITLQNTLFYLLGYSIFLDYSDEIIKFTEENFGSSLITVASIGVVVSPNIIYTIFRSFLKPY